MPPRLGASRPAPCPSDLIGCPRCSPRSPGPLMLQWLSSTRAAAKAITPEVIGRPPSDGPAEPHGEAAGQAGELVMAAHLITLMMTTPLSRGEVESHSS